jgi:hypothetical protein
MSHPKGPIGQCPGCQKVRRLCRTSSLGKAICGFCGDLEHSGAPPRRGVPMPKKINIPPHTIDAMTKGKTL